MNDETIGRIEKLPQDGKHFTLADMMADALKSSVKPKDDDPTMSELALKLKALSTGTTTTTSSYPIYPNTIPYIDTIGGGSLKSTPAYTTSVWNGTITMPQTYEVDFDQIKTLEDIITILQKMNITFTGRDSVRGLEHLVKKK